jgi:hypothetical protein
LLVDSEGANKEGIVKYGFKDKPGESNRFSSKPGATTGSEISDGLYESRSHMSDGSIIGYTSDLLK